MMTLVGLEPFSICSVATSVICMPFLLQIFKVYHVEAGVLWFPPCTHEIRDGKHWVLEKDPVG